MKSRFQKKLKKQYGGSLNDNETKTCENLELFLQKTGVTDAELKADLGNILKNCNTLDKDNCVITNYLNSDEWYNITNQLRKGFQSNNLKSAMETQMTKLETPMPLLQTRLTELETELETKKEQLETQITEVKDQMSINKYLLANVFNATTMNKAPEEAFTEVLNLKKGKNDKFQLDCGICSQEELWNTFVGDAEKEENGSLLASVTKASEYCAAQSGGRRSRQKKRKLGRRSYKLH
jgi:hypothetical protein